MKVTTLNKSAFEAACRELEKVCRGFEPDLVAGIASGGVYVAELMLAGVKHCAVGCRRPSSKAKDSHSALWRIVRRMPLWLRDMLRRAEARMLARRSKPTLPEARIDVEDRAAIKSATRILIVDDAVDSGATMKTVSDILRQINPQAQIATASITVTTRNPLVSPDYRLFADLRLIRFPWSKDFSE